ncbi:MAG: beta-ketoacyl synthase N-terminal-like domain-containing protein, partial [Desulfosudaceae bacterium]
MSKGRNNTNDRKIAIVGIGSLFPKAGNLKEYWRLLFHGEDAITEVPETHWSAADYYRENPGKGDFTYCKRGSFLSPISYDPTEFGLPPNMLEATDTSQLLSLVVAKRALEDAGYGESGRPWDRERTGVILGITGTQELVIPLSARLGFPHWEKALTDAGVSEEQKQQVMEQIADSYVSWQENSFPGLLGNVVAGRIANRFNLGGTNCVTDAACASSLSAMHLAVMELAAGNSDMMITGGVDTLNDIFMHMCFAKTSVLSFSGDARPFSKDADGTVLGEGLGLFVLKRLADAERDNDRVYAVIRAMGTSSDGRSSGIYAPVPEGQLRALKRAYLAAGVEPDTVELIEAHGTGTRVGDAKEFEALRKLFGDTGRDKNQCAIGSVKSMIGHTKAAAGAASLAKTTLALYHKSIPPTLKVDEPDPKLGLEETPFYISTTARPWFSNRKHPRRAGMSSFGFGGSNYHMVLEEYTPDKTEVAWDGTVEILAFSGGSRKDLSARILEFKNRLEEYATGHRKEFDGVRLYAAESRQRFSSQDEHRALIVLEHTDDVAGVIDQAVEKLRDSRDDFFNSGPLYYGCASSELLSNSKIAFIFPGQGSQYAYMARDLATVFPEVHDVFEMANNQFANFRKGSEHRLTDYVFPPGFRSDNKEEAEAALRQTDIAQPAIGAASLGMAAVLKRFGVTADMMGGHSFGELSALCCAGWINLEDFLSLASARGKYMAAAGREKGAMLAVRSDLASIEALITDNELDLVLANRNSHDQGVLSGRAEEIDRAAAICRDNRIKAMKLPVSAAFHTELVQDAAKPFRDYLRKKAVTPTAIPVFSNTTAEPYPAEEDEARQILGRQILNPVNFVSEVENMAAAGAGLFLEIGPKTVLTGLVKSILKGRPARALALDASGGRKFGVKDIAATLAFFAAAGRPVLLENWEELPRYPEREQKMTIPICGANYRKEPPRRFSPPASATPERVEPVASTPTSAEEAAAQAPPLDGEVVRNALKVVSESLQSLQTLQQQTAQAHHKFLETQNEAGRALGVVIERTRHIGSTILNEGTSLPGRKQFSAAAPESSPESSLEAFPEATPEAAAAVAPEAAAAAASEPSPAASPADTPAATTAAPSAATTPASNAAEPSPPDAAKAAVIEQAMLDIVSRVTGYPVE